MEVMVLTHDASCGSVGIDRFKFEKAKIVEGKLDNMEVSNIVVDTRRVYFIDNKLIEKDNTEIFCWRKDVFTIEEYENLLSNKNSNVFKIRQRQLEREKELDIIMS